jgi:hypothetical protein
MLCVREALSSRRYTPDVRNFNRMMERRPRLANRILVPRALAVLSCALALLAVQPAATAVHAPATSLTHALTSQRSTQHPQLATTPLEAPSRKIRRDEDIFASARRFHILATVEIFKRLLLAELRPPAAEHSLAALFCYTPVDSTLVAPALQPRIATRPPDPSPPPCERQFAIEHCLSAPPLA